MLSQNEKDKLMKQIFIILALLGMAYGFSIFSNKEAVVKEVERKENLSQVRITASINSLEEETRNKVLETLRNIQ